MKPNLYIVPKFNAEKATLTRIAFDETEEHIFFLLIEEYPKHQSPEQHDLHQHGAK